MYEYVDLDAIYLTDEAPDLLHEVLYLTVICYRPITVPITVICYRPITVPNCNML